MPDFEQSEYVAGVPESELRARVDAALDVVAQYGGIPGEHHRAWVTDQMVRALTGPLYPEWVRWQKFGEDGPETYSWDVGIPP